MRGQFQAFHFWEYFKAPVLGTNESDFISDCIPVCTPADTFHGAQQQLLNTSFLYQPVDTSHFCSNVTACCQMCFFATRGLQRVLHPHRLINCSTVGVYTVLDELYVQCSCLQSDMCNVSLFQGVGGSCCRSGGCHLWVSLILPHYNVSRPHILFQFHLALLVMMEKKFDQQMQYIKSAHFTRIWVFCPYLK